MGSTQRRAQWMADPRHYMLVGEIFFLLFWPSLVLKAVSATGRTEIEVGADEVAVIRLINPPANDLSIDVLNSLKANYDQALQRDDIKAIVITGVEGNFCGSFDPFAIGDIQEGKAQAPISGYVAIDIFTDTIEDAKKPTVAAIDGIATGGGLELAMSCHARISTSNALLGNPELVIGFIPGFGGTQRLPRLVGVANSLEMLLTSKLVKGDKALTLGLVDAITSQAELLKTARLWALDILEGRRPWVSTLKKTDKLEPVREAKDILSSARTQARKQSPNLEHPLVCINVIEEGIVSGPLAGLWKEAEEFNALLFSNNCKGFVHIYLTQLNASKVVGVTDRGLVPRSVKKVGILGGGLVGSGIATTLIISNYQVILKEVNETSLQAGIGRVKANLQSRVEKGEMTRDQFKSTISLLRGSLDYESFRDVDMAIEAVTGNLLLKQQIFADLEEYCPSHCILASTTSTIDLNLIGQRTKSSDRIIGAHFFTPVDVIPLLEIVRTEKTSLQVIVDLLDIGLKIGKTPIVVKNGPGFAVNRMFFPYTQAAILLAEHGIDIYRIDQAITKFGITMGPFRLCDLVGLDVELATWEQYLEHFPDRVYKSSLLPLMIADKRAGEVTRKGFYAYNDRGEASPDPEVKKYIKKSRSMSHVLVDPKLSLISDEEITKMILFPIVNEACRVYAEGITIKTADLDIASVLAKNFPAYRGGVMFWGDLFGAREIHSRLEEWANEYGALFKPSPYLVEKAATNAPLSSPLD